MKKQIINKIFLVFIIIITVSCGKQKMFKDVNYKGIAYDHKTGLPLVGFKIQLKACGGGSGDQAIYGCSQDLFNIASAVTDASGHFSITGKAARSNIYYVFIVFNGGNYGAFSDGVSEAELNSEYSTIYLYP